MKLRSKRSTSLKRRNLLILIVLIGLGSAVYFHLHTKLKVDSPATIQPITPEARDATRMKYLKSLAVALEKSYKLHGKYPFATPKTEIGICSGSRVHCTQVKLLDLNTLIADGFLDNVPSDPVGGRGQYNSGFSLRRQSDGSLELLAPRTEGPVVLSVKL